MDSTVFVGAAKRVAGARASIRDKVFVKIMVSDGGFVMIDNVLYADSRSLVNCTPESIVSVLG
jgi:hypothetical protein